MALVGSHATYNVGPGKTYTTVASFPWLNLVAGDVVNVYPNVVANVNTPYATKIGLRASGTASAPVVINGVADSNGNLPIISGNNAITSADAIAQGFFATTGGSIIESSGVIVIYRGAGDTFGYQPSFLTIQNLQITGGAVGNSFTNHSGVVTAYGSFTAGIYVVGSQELTIQNDVIYGNGLGVFVNDGVSGSTYFTTLRGNYIHDNGVVGSYTEHNVYVQGVRSLYEGNYITTLINGAAGGSLKDRSSGPVVRYNYIVSAARAIDLVDSENGGGGALGDPLYNVGFVYGNLIVNDFNIAGAGSGDLVHWGGDSTIYTQYHNGPLYFYDNTIYNIATSTQAGGTLAMFDMPTNSQSIVASNIIIGITGNASLSLCTNSATNGTVGTLNFFNKNWSAIHTGGAACTFDEFGAFVAGNPVLTGAYRLPAGSPAIGQGMTYPPSTLVVPSPASIPNLQVTEEFVLGTPTDASQPTFTTRSSVKDLGAFAYP